MKKVDLCGKKFNRLTVVNFTGYRSGHSMWGCKCDCGNICEKSGPHLQSGHTTSCGCQRLEKIKVSNSKPRSDETKLKMSQSKFGRRGEDTNHWQGGKAPLEKRMRWSPEYRQVRREALKRDDYTCKKCGENDSDKLVIHHIVPWMDNFSLWFELSNIITICKDCHKKEHPTWIDSLREKKKIDKEEIIRLREKGMLYEEIGKKLNLNRNLVSKIFRENQENK